MSDPLISGEAPVSSPSVLFDNVIVTPRMAGLTRQTSIRRARVAASNVLRVLAGDGRLEGAVE